MAAALAAAPAIIEAGMTYGPAAYQAAQLSHHLYKKYKPGVKRVANHVFSKHKRKSALNYARGLGTKKGLHKFVSKDLGRAAGATSKYIKSGKALKAAQGVSHDLSRMVDIANPYLEDDQYQAMKSGLKSFDKHASHYHQIAEKYNEHGDKIQNMFKGGGPKIEHVQQLQQAFGGGHKNMGVSQHINPATGGALAPGLRPPMKKRVPMTGKGRMFKTKASMGPRRLDVRPV